MPPRRKYNPVANRANKYEDVQARHNAFEQAFKLNGGNATQAAIEAGYSPKAASVQGSNLAKRLSLRRAASGGQAAAFENSRLTTERVLRELERIVFSDVRKVYDKRGRVIHPHKLDDDTASAVSSYDVDDEGNVKVRLHDKMVAIDRAMKHLGLFERDNRQKERNLTIQVGLVSAPRAKDSG